MSIPTFQKSILTSPGKIISGSLAGIIAIGAFLLWLPASHCCPITFLDALFTATSATCVTGLLSIPLSSFTFSGQCIILLLMQIGGLGLVTFTIFLISLFFELKLSTRMLTEKMLEIDSWEASYHLLLFIVLMTLAVETLGTICVFYTIKDIYPTGQALFYALFHAVSAFTTTGLSFLENDQGLMPHNMSLLGVTASLVFIGGLGFIVWDEIVAHIISWREKKHTRWSLHTKLVLYMTALIIISSTCMFFYLEYMRTGLSGTWSGALITSLFNAIACRSAGFTTLCIPAIHLATLFLIMVVSFIGSSPGSTGSGIKTTTFALFLAAIRATILRRSVVEIKGRTIPNEQIFKAMAVLSLSLTWIAITIFFLLITEQGWRFIDISFEAFSAFSNLGLSTGITPYLSIAGKYILITTMFIGRVGSLTLLLAFQSHREKRVPLPRRTRYYWITKDPPRMKFCVIGIGRFGHAVATTLANRGMEVMAVDSSPTIVESIKDSVSQAICMEITDEESLLSLGIQDMDAVVVAMGENFDQSILITALLKQNLKFPRVIVRSISTIHKNILHLVGADQIILPEQEIGTLLADNLSLHFESLAILTPEFSISKVRVPKKFVGKTIPAIHEQSGVLCIGRDENGIAKPLTYNYTVGPTDVLLLSGSNKDLERISKL